MKKIEVLTLKVDTLLDSYYPTLYSKAIDQWMSSEEYKFIEKNSISIEQVKIEDYTGAERIISYHAVMDEKIETFWRLKFK